MRDTPALAAEMLCAREKLARVACPVASPKKAAALHNTQRVTSTWHIYSLHKQVHRCSLPMRLQPPQPANTHTNTHAHVQTNCRYGHGMDVQIACTSSKCKLRHTFPLPASTNKCKLRHILPPSGALPEGCRCCPAWALQHACCHLLSSSRG